MVAWQVRTRFRLASAAILVQGRQREPDGKLSFTPHLIDADSGIGTQFVVADLDGDGKLDIITSNKKGVRVVYQRAK